MQLYAMAVCTMFNLAMKLLLIRMEWPTSLAPVPLGGRETDVISTLMTVDQTHVRMGVHVK